MAGAADRTMPAANEAEADVRILRASRRRKLLLALGLVVVCAGAAVAHVLTLLHGDLITLPPVGGQQVAMVPVQHNPEPPLRPPRGRCAARARIRWRASRVACPPPH